MKFLDWMENRKDLAQVFKSLLSGVPQDPAHHPEGDVLTHVRLVRKAIPRAIRELKDLQENHPELRNILSELDFSVSSEEKELLSLAAWLHDVGKSTATKTDEKGKITARGHQNPEHYLPLLKQMQKVAPPKTVELYANNADLINFLVERHMDFTTGGFPKEIIAKYFRHGKVQNNQRMKLLLILMWADKMGRKPESVILKALPKNISALIASSERSRKRDEKISKQSKPFFGTADDFAKMLVKKPMTLNQKVAAIKGKFPFLSDKEIGKLF